MSATETEDMADTTLQNEGVPQSANDLDNNSDISTSNQSAQAASPSGARALANLLMMEHDFRRTRYAREIANILASRLDGFAHCDGVIVWVKKNKSNDIIMSRFDGSQLKTIKDKNLEKWAKKLAKWMDRTNAPAGELKTETIPAKIFDLWPDIFPLEGLHVPLTSPGKGRAGGVLLIRSQPWGEAIKIMLQQLGEAAGYSLKAIELGVYDKSASNLPLLLSLLGIATLLSGTALTVMDIFPTPDVLQPIIQLLRNLTGLGT